MMGETAFIGIDLGGTDLKIVVMSDDGTILGARRARTEASSSRDAILAQIVFLVGQLRDDIEASDPSTQFAAIGLAVPGVIDATAGRVEFTVALEADWNGFLATTALEQLLGLPTFLINDAQAATFGEQMLGGGRGYRDFACITVGTGIGGGLVMDGRLYSGSRGMSGVLGHTTVLPDGPLCGCGNHGCLEMVASGAAITRAAKQTKLAHAFGDEPVGIDSLPRAVADAARNGNEIAKNIYEEAGVFLGIALGNLVCILNPQAIVVGGGVSQAGDLLLEPIRREIKQRTVVFSEERGGVDVIQSPLGTDAGAIGSARWASRGVR
jgi:glucokinase